MIGCNPLSPPNDSALDEDIIDAIDAQQADLILTPEMQERVRSRLMQRISQCMSTHSPDPATDADAH